MNTRFFPSAIVLISLLTISQYSHAQWISTSGPRLAKPVAFLSVAVKGDTLFAGSYQNDSLYRSTDNGATWSVSLCAEHINDIIVRGGMVYACNYEGVFRSTDYGSTWVLGSTGLPQLNFSAVNTLEFLGGFIFAATNNGVYRSNDGGDNWSNASSGLRSDYPTISALAVSGSILLAGTDDGVYRSTNLGGTWSAAHTGMPLDFRGLHPRVWHLAATPDGIFAGTDAYGVYRSTNTGTRWDSVNVGLPHRSNVPALYEGVFSLAYTGTKLVTGLEDRSIYLSSNNGASWYLGTSRITAENLAFDLKVRGNTLFAATFSGVYRSTEVESVWLPVFTHFVETASVRPLFAAPGNVIAGGMTISWNSAMYNTFYSSNGGQDWNEIDSLSPRRSFSCFLMSGNILLGGSLGGIYLSTDEGVHWAAADSSPSNYYLNHLVRQGNNLFAATGFLFSPFGESGGVFKSTNNGASWVDAGLLDTTIMVLGSAGQYLFAGGARRVYRSTDEGISWTVASSGLTTSQFARSFATVGSDVFFSTTRSVYKSTDFGTNWIPVNAGLPADSINWYHPLLDVGGNLFLGTRSGIFRTTNLGVNWENVSHGLADKALQVSSLTVQGSVLFAGTSDGVWRRPVSEVVAGTDTSTLLPKAFHLYQNYPNPFNATTILRYDVPYAAHVTLKVFDVLGREVAVVVREWQTPGTHTYNFDASQLASGVYFYRLQAGTTSIVKKMVLAK